MVSRRFLPDPSQFFNERFRLTETRFVIALQEGLIALAPFVVLASFLTLASQLPPYFGIKDNQALTILTQLAVGLRLFTSIAVVLSLA